MLRRRKHCAFLAFAACIIAIHYLHSKSPSTRLLHSSQANSALDCPRSSTKTGILAVLRTGATEALQKLPVQFETILQCIPDYVIYSDYEEEIQGHRISDVFDETNDVVKSTLPEFQLYKHLQEHGREGLKSEIHLGSGPAGSLENPGWKLDKFKFLPMVEKALRHRPDAEWFVFIEPDTYLVWENLLEYLSHFDASKPFYMGKHVYIGDVFFAHGGSGVALSKAAIQRVSSHWNANKDAYLQYTRQQWAGDMVLGRALRDVDIHPFWAFPNLQGDPVSSLDYNITKIQRHPWCFAPITYHHMQPDEIRNMWAFEKGWTQKNGRTMLHSDVFREFILPQLSERRDDWDNLSFGTEYSALALAQVSAAAQQLLSETEKNAHRSFEDCRSVCQSKSNCMQFSHTSGKCFVSVQVRHGFKASSKCLEYSNAAGKCVEPDKSSAAIGSGSDTKEYVHSGWMMGRMETYMQDLTDMCSRNNEGPWVV